MKLEHLNVMFSLSHPGDFQKSLHNHHLCSEAKEVEEERADSCVECWANVEDNTKCKNKKKKRKGKSLCNDQVRG